MGTDIHSIAQVRRNGSWEPMPNTKHSLKLSVVITNPDGKLDESESLWRRNEFDRGYKAGYEGSAYSPTSLSYIEGYESGELAAMRAGKRRA